MENILEDIKSKLADIVGFPNLLTIKVRRLYVNACDAGIHSLLYTR